MEKRTFWKQEGLDDPEAFSNNGPSFKPRSATYEFNPIGLPQREMVPEAEANLVSSFTVNGMQRPTIDIDLPVAVRPSKTEGHYHLFIDKDLTWDQYENLLLAMADCGIVEWNYVWAAKRARMTFVRSNPESRPDREGEGRNVKAPGSVGYGPGW